MDSQRVEKPIGDSHSTINIIRVIITFKFVDSFSFRRKFIHDLDFDDFIYIF